MWQTGTLHALKESFIYSSFNGFSLCTYVDDSELQDVNRPDGAEELCDHNPTARRAGLD